VASARFASRRLLRRLRSQGILEAQTLLVGANEEGLALAEQLMQNPGTGIHLVGFIDNAFDSGVRTRGPLPILGSLRDLPEIIADRGIREIIVATTALPRAELLDLYQSYGSLDGVEIRLSSGLFEILTTGVSVQEIAFVPLMTPQRVRITGVDAVLKAILDHVLAAVGLIVLSPILLVIGLLVRLDSPGPILYRRRVLGRSGRQFDALKFRTMVVDAEAVLIANRELQEEFARGYKLKVDPRVTRVGRWLRRTSLDELPQLVNVLLGEMSLVGPRMITAEEAARYGKWQLNLLTVKPGITGPWQVQGRSDIPYDERVRLSMNYVRNYTIWSDLEILLRTIPAVLQSRGAY
jgi:exopolysaccharide biosynthesis polyprenyl glycosylphosphotransferase